ncbi:unnamed protein product [Nyctereutes procyonoides]|uniref:(raccoon dog) hypothetical protein n=1 Tax=Nyctereutes procyonoides TaxID=34880 RepID=A0A811XXV5_NYCPR|nr:unnamed protein product [Nyctereutes procyonoides]
MSYCPGNLNKPSQNFKPKLLTLNQKVKLADIQIEQLNRTKKHTHLTDTEIMTLVDETNMYEGEVIHNQLLEKQKIRSVKEAEDNIREMLMARRAQ